MDVVNHVLKFTSFLTIALFALGVSIVGSVFGVQIPNTGRIPLFVVANIAILASLASNFRLYYRNGQFSKGLSSWGRSISTIEHVFGIALFLAIAIGAFVGSCGQPDHVSELEKTLATYLELSEAGNSEQLINLSYLIYSQCGKGSEISDQSVRAIVQLQCKALLGGPITSDSVESALLALRQVKP
jgi:hypothetical protein